ncbi:MAG: HAD-IIA family hydrolase [Candidatus Nanopelagicales bacterium]
MTGVPVTGVPVTGGLLGAEQAPARVHDVALLDLDGVVYVGSGAVPHAIEALTAASAAGLRLCYVTNNASRPPQAVADHLRALGLPADVQEVVTSAQAGAHLLADLVPPGSRVLAVGGSGVDEALRSRGLVPVRRTAAGNGVAGDGVAGDGVADVAAVLQGFGPDVGWRELADAALVLARGVPWIATNRDLTIPIPGGRAPGNGALVAAVATAVGRDPTASAGKPEPALMAESVERARAERPLVVGDRLDTDILGGNRAGLPTLAVLTGVSGVADLLDAAPPLRPGLVGADLRALLAPHEPAVPDGRGWRCGDAAAVVAGASLQVSAPSPLTAGAGVRMLRVACAAVWTARDHGMDPEVTAAAATIEAALAADRDG